MRSFLTTRAALLIAATACAADTPEAPAHRNITATAASTVQAPTTAPSTETGPTTPPGTRVTPSLDVLRTLMTPYTKDTLRAAADGWNARVTDCMTDPVLGGMGVHYADLARFDTTLDANRPELLVYAPTREHRVVLVAVEYAVPLAAWTKPQPPSLFGRPFHVNQQFGLWVLHAWVGRANPSGVFTDWNPNVSCTP